MDKDFICKNCGMLKINCICSSITSKSSKMVNISKNQISDIKRSNPHIDHDIIENFPFPHPREGQLDIIAEIKGAITEGFRYIILEAGTGTGKSAIASTLARMYQPAYILTMTKQLQSQYAHEFGYPLVKGRSNFACKEDDLESTCDIGTCQTTPSSQNFSCPYGITKSDYDKGIPAFKDAFENQIYFKSPDKCNYWEQKAEAVNSKITLMNYDYALLELNYVKHFNKRNIMILDEAHNIEDKLMHRLEVNIYNKRLEKDIKKSIPRSMMEYEDPSEWLMFIESTYEDYKAINIKNIPKNKADRINRTKRRLNELLNNLEENPKNWVVDSSPGGVSFKPLKVNMYAEENLLKHADVCLFMSATILDHKLFSKWLGIHPAELYSIKVDSNFPSSKRPVFIKTRGKLSANSIKYTAPKTIPVLNKIIKHHKHEKGLIHTHNYKCQEYIMNNIHNSRLVSHNSQNREYQLNQFEKSKDPLILVSPSMSEGVDLPYDQCQFQVIYKIPFPYLGDKQVNKRMKRDPRWYAYKTVMTLIQAYGRGMRAEDDYCATYILDGNIDMMFKSPRYRSLVPKFFKEAVQRDD